MTSPYFDPDLDGGDDALAEQLADANKRISELEAQLSIQRTPEPEPSTKPEVDAPEAPKPLTPDEVLAKVNAATNEAELSAALTELGQPMIDAHGNVVTIDERGGITRTPAPVEFAEPSYQSMDHAQLTAAISEAEALPTGPERDKRLAELGVPTMGVIH